MDRRKFTKTIGLLTGAAALTGLYAWQVEPGWLEFVKHKIFINKLPPHLWGKILMQISDIHAGAVDKNYLVDSLQKANALEPDIVVYTGDFITDNKGKEFKEIADVLAYKATGKLATIGILGNHDYGPDWQQAEIADRVTHLVNSAGIKVLRNEILDVEGLNIIGIDELWGTNFKPGEVMEKYRPDTANLVLCHNPDACDLDIWNGYKGWILSGHTHGGQVKPPFLPPPVVPVNNKKYTAGKIDLQDGRTLYINRALGYKWKLRFNVRPEITLFEMQPA